MRPSRLALALLSVGLVMLLVPTAAHAWTPGTHIYLGESVLANLALLPTAVADLLRAYPFDFLYGNIAADSSIAKSYAPPGPPPPPPPRAMPPRATSPPTLRSRRATRRWAATVTTGTWARRSTIWR